MSYTLDDINPILINVGYLPSSLYTTSEDVLL